MGNAFAHIELNTDDPAAATKFYASIFDWKVTDMPDMGYTMVDFGKKDTGGGIQKKMDGAPTAWLPYVSVGSVKATIAKAQKAGAQVVVPYQDIGDMGAIGIFVDPTGAAMGVWESKTGPKAKAARKAIGEAVKAAAKKPAKKKKKKAAKPAKKAAKKTAKKTAKKKKK